MAVHSTRSTFVDILTCSYAQLVKFIFFLGFVFFLDCKTAVTEDVTQSPICGSSLYDIETLKSVPYWTITRPGICYETLSNVPCVFNLAFCKALPPLQSGGEPNIGASQITSPVGSAPVVLVLGHTNYFTDDRSGNQLIVGYPNGANVTCGFISVLMFLRCNENANWQVPTDGEPAEIPLNPTVVLQPSGCLYVITAEYAGACETVVSTGLSAGTILIIIFFVVVAAYLVVGVIYNKIAGAQGYELIPNYSTWKRLPSDIAVGCGFFFGCITCQGGQQTSTDSYDSI